MSLRNEQCNKVCRILDDVLANRPTERDSLITAVRKAFGALETEPKWIPCSERMPEEGQNCLVCDKGSIGIDTYIGHGNPYNWEWYVRDYEAWLPLPEPYMKGVTK